MVLVKNLKFCQLLVSCKMHQGKVFGDVLVRKQALLDNRNVDLRRLQNWHFAKGLVHDFGQKIEVFFIFCVYQIYIEKKIKNIRTSVYDERKFHLFPKG